MSAPVVLCEDSLGAEHEEETSCGVDVEWDESTKVASESVDDGDSCVYYRACVVVRPGKSNPRYSVGDFVTLRESPDLLHCGSPPVALICAMWDAVARSGPCCHAQWAEVRLFCRPGRPGAPSRKPFHGEAEVVACRERCREVLILECVAGHCLVEDFQSFVGRTEFPELVFYCQEEEEESGTRLLGCRIKDIAGWSSPRSKRIHGALAARKVSASASPLKRLYRADDRVGATNTPTTSAAPTKQRALASWIQQAAAGVKHSPSRFGKLCIEACDSETETMSDVPPRCTPFPTTDRLPKRNGRQLKMTSFVRQAEPLAVPPPPEKKTKVYRDEEDEEDDQEKGLSRRHRTSSFVVPDDDPALAADETAPVSAQIGGDDEGERWVQLEAVAPGKPPVAGAEEKKREEGARIPPLYTLRQAFEVYLQYLASACVDPDFVNSVTAPPSGDDGGLQSEHAAYFKPAIMRVERELLSRKEALVSSSVWHPEFQNHLETLPRLRSYYAKGEEGRQEDCSACRRSRQPAMFTLSLNGAPYDSKALWDGDLYIALAPLTKDEEAMEFRLGSVCHRRAQLFHRIEHFKYTLLRTLQTRLDTISKSRPPSSSPPSAAALVTSLLDNAEWVGANYDIYKNLLDDADSFGLEESHR